MSTAGRVLLVTSNPSRKPKTVNTDTAERSGSDGRIRLGKPNDVIDGTHFSLWAPVEWSG